MSTITKQWLKQKTADMEATRDEIPFGLDEDDSNTLAALRIALASLEAEAVAYADPQAFRNFQAGAARREWMWRNPGEDLIPLFIAPPAPVSVPDEQNWEDLCEQNPEMPIADAIIRAASWNACRAAMLQGADGTLTNEGTIQDSNSPGIPDGWVACSELMPGIGTEIFYFCQDDGLRDCGIVSSSNFSGKGHAELYVHAEGYDLRFGVDITHWMPLPAAPQHK